MSKTDAERAMEIYRVFTRQTDNVVQYLSVARQYEHHTRVEVPKLKHAPVNLGRQLEEYLNDSDFEIHRRQYLAEQDAKKGGGGSSSKASAAPKKETARFAEPASNNPFPAPSSKATSQPEMKAKPNKGPDPDLIDFFDSIEQNQTPMQMNPQALAQAPIQVQPPPQQMNNFQTQPTGLSFQSNGFAPQQTGFATTSPFQQQPQAAGAFIQPPPQQQQIQPNFTGAGFGGYTPQQGFQPGSLASIPQDSVASFQNPGAGVQPIQNGQPQALQPMQTGSTNPFRQSMLMAQQTGAQNNPFPTSNTTTGLTRQATNPFARRSPQETTSPFAASPSPNFQQIPQQAQPDFAVQQAPAPLLPAPTGTNPFARTMPQNPPQAGPAPALAPQATGSTNPFRQGAFVNHNTGMGWQHNQSAIGGGLDQLETVPVFPRPAQQTPWQQ